ncbi:hypothetical protein GCM10025868_08670 [Angustibacter aerolatus]|uniref:Uncharacterized protein n=1 Tax=Angustibacter aerolatus TaxID=1162965 RepID=A0ABQ6JBT1_9ACTN|nr:hypothetical protein [Angustibacter aerolatus]GMA85617.1 hypothetical protein GCM10025868_08670 [Angustibacter aerolatus]
MSVLDQQSVVAVTSPFGPFDLLSDVAHEHYLDGFSERAVQAAAEAACLAEAAGDRQTLRYLLYTRGVALIEVKRWQEAADVAQQAAGHHRRRRPGLAGQGAVAARRREPAAGSGVAGRRRLG